MMGDIKGEFIEKDGLEYRDMFILLTFLSILASQFTNHDAMNNFHDI